MDNVINKLATGFERTFKGSNLQIVNATFYFGNMLAKILVV